MGSDGNYMEPLGQVSGSLVEELITLNAAISACEKASRCSGNSGLR